MRTFVCAAALVAAGCLPPIPQGMGIAALAPVRGTASVCRLTGEKIDRPLLIGIDALSFETWHQCIGAVVVKRPEGMLVIDPSFGRSIGRDIAQSSLLSKLILGSAYTKTPLVDSMDKAGIDPLKVKWIALTHAHWDHTGAIPDLTRAQIRLSRVEQKTYWNLKGHLNQGAMPDHFAVPEGRFEPFDFDGPPLLGFSASHDLFKDGSVVAVPTPGHTPGSVSYLVRGDDGKAWLFIGDAAWSVEGVKRPAHKNPLIAAALDQDSEAMAKTLGQLHAVAESLPSLTVVPAHDFAAFGQLPECQP